MADKYRFSNNMNILDERIRQIDAAVHRATVSTEGVLPELNELARQLCEHFELGFGTLIRRAKAISLTDGMNGCLAREHLQEAAQHLVVKARSN